MKLLLVTICIFYLAELTTNLKIAEFKKDLKSIPDKMRAIKVSSSRAGKTLENEIRKSTDRPLSSLLTIQLNSDLLSNNLDQIVGRVVKVKINPTGDANEYEIMSSIVNDKDSLRIKLAPVGDEDTFEIKNDKALSFNFMGISPNLSKNELYEYKSVCVSTCAVSDKKLDKTKIPTYALCNGSSDCPFYYIIGASVRLCEVTRYKKIGTKLTIKDLAGFGVAKPFESQIAVGSEKSQHAKKYVIFCTLFRVPQ